MRIANKWFDVGEKRQLPGLVLLAACFEYAVKFPPGSGVISLHSVAYGFNAPGAAFKLSETDLGRRL